MSTEHVLVKADELKDGEMKEIEVREDFTVLLVRRNGMYRAFGGTCPHHGASLAEGILHDKHIRCPWHHAVFDAETGNVEDVPSLDSIPRFDVRIEGGDYSMNWAPASGREEWTYQLDTRALENGPYTIYARAFDGDRYSAIASAEVQVKNPNTPPEMIRVIATPQ